MYEIGTEVERDFFRKGLDHEPGARGISLVDRADSAFSIVAQRCQLLKRRPLDAVLSRLRRDWRTARGIRTTRFIRICCAVCLSIVPFSMDGQGALPDNIFIERPMWRSTGGGRVHAKAYVTVQARASARGWRFSTTSGRIRRWTTLAARGFRGAAACRPSRRSTRVAHVSHFSSSQATSSAPSDLVQDRHFAAIRASDFVWVVCPDGYTGASTCMEIAWAAAAGVPVFSSAPVRDATVAEYVDPAASVADVIERFPRPRQFRSPDHVLLDPAASIDLCMRTLDDLRPVLLGNEGDRRSDAEQWYERARRTIRRSLAL